MTDIEHRAPAAPDVTLDGGALLQTSDEEFAALTHTLSVEDLLDAGLFLTQVSKVSSIRVGQVAYEIRLQTPDGQWGRRVFELAEQWEVSERTIHRWMSGAQAHFGLELTAAQKNAQAAPPADAPSEEGEAPGAEPAWDDWDEELGEAGFDLGGEEGGHPLTDWMNDEAGWASAGAPQPQRGTPEEGAAPAGRPVALPADDTWVAFTAHSIMQEHENYSEDAAARSARARWARKIEEDPLDLLEELELIYESSGGTVPDEAVEALHAAEEAKPIKPDEVTEGGGKKKRGPKSRKLAYDVAERMIADMRHLHEMCSTGTKDGSVPDREVAAMLPHLVLMPHAVAGLKKMAQEAKDRVLSQESPAERVEAARAAADGGGEEF